MEHEVFTKRSPPLLASCSSSEGPALTSTVSQVCNSSTAFYCTLYGRLGSNAGKSLVDLWSYDGTTGVCNCNPRALCLGINNGTSICTGVFVPNTIQLVTGLGGVINGVLVRSLVPCGQCKLSNSVQTLGSASGGQVLSVMMSKSPVAVTKVSVHCFVVHTDVCICVF
jgi:hypothetical protein